MRFLLICEQALIRDGFCNLLRSLEIGDDLTVYDTDGVQSAASILNETRPIDLLIYYLNLDDRGWAGLDELGALGIDAPVIAVAGFRNDGDIRRAIQQGANGCVSTDFTWRVVASVIERVLQGEIVSPSIKGRPADTCEVKAEGVTPGDANRPDTTATALDQKLAQLTPRQREVLQLIKLGKSNKEIARYLDVAEGTVKIHCAAIFRELGVTNRTQAALLAGDMALR